MTDCNKKISQCPEYTGGIPNNLIFPVVDTSTYTNYNYSYADLASSMSDYIQSVTGITSSGLTYNAPAGIMLESIIVTNIYSGITISLSTTDELTEDIISEVDCLTNISTYQLINYTSGPGFPSFDIYISAIIWTDSNINLYLLLKKII